MAEFDLIAQVFRPLAGDPGAQGLGDDGACLPRLPAGQEWRITTDTLVEGVHFRATDPLDAVAWRALATNVSDLVAQAAQPRAYFLNLALGKGFDGALFGGGLAQAQAAFGLSLFGGDTVQTPGPLTITITALGQGQIGRNPLRSKAQVGDRVGLLCAPHGALGAAKAGFEGVEAFAQAYLRPQPCLGALHKLADVNAVTDISDGLMQDLGHICAASGVGAVIELAAIPVALPEQPKLAQITWGDDYGLVMTAPQLPAIAGLVALGRVEEGQGVKLLDAQGREIRVETPGFVHGRPL